MLTWPRMDAKKVLEKFGWNEGQGLGKNNNGMPEPIKVIMKRDNGGVGFKPSDEFTDDWWHTMFDEASKRITIENNDEVAIRKRKRKRSEQQPTTKQPTSINKMKCKQQSLYGGFLQSSVAIVNGQVKGNTEQKEKETSTTDSATCKRLSDDQLFAACGGRTAHKAARHGFKLSGKLRRLLQQEAECSSNS